MDCSLPCKIGSKVSIKEYNKFITQQESSHYKYQREENGDVYIIDMSSDPEHSEVASLLISYFNIPNNHVFIDPPIRVRLDECK